MIFLAKGLHGVLLRLRGPVYRKRIVQNGDQIGHAGSIPCGLRVGWNRRYDQQLHYIASNCRLKVVIAGPNEILLVLDKIPETTRNRYRPDDIERSWLNHNITMTTAICSLSKSPAT